MARKTSKTPKKEDTTIVVHIMPLEKQDYIDYCVQVGMNGSMLLRMIIDEMKRETKATGVPLFTSVSQESHDYLMELLRGRQLCEYIEELLDNHGVEQESSKEGEVFTKTDIRDFLEICETRNLDPRFALRKAISALSMRQI